MGLNYSQSKLSTDEDSDNILKVSLGHITFTLEYHSFESCDDLYPEQAEAKYKSYFLNKYGFRYQQAFGTRLDGEVSPKEEYKKSVISAFGVNPDAWDLFQNFSGTHEMHESFKQDFQRLIMIKNCADESGNIFQSSNNFKLVAKKF
jgi:hypothetical protein